VIIDVHAHLGHYPFSRLAACDAAGLVALMDRHGITKAVVSSLNSVFYRHAHAGNEELMAEVAKAPDRLVPLATVDPSYAGWEFDLELAVGRWRVRGIYLVPGYHPYQLNDEPGRRALRRVAAGGLPVVLPQRLEDRRRRHWMDTTEDLRFEEVAQAARAFPELKFVLLNWGRLDVRKIRAAGLAGRILIDMTRLAVRLDREIPELIEGLGVEAVAFGTDLPISTPGPALVKLAMLDFLSAADLERIKWRNTAEFLWLPP
jgi:predicted TIM-barrel fold metal-dependent hydrolase